MFIAEKCLASTDADIPVQATVYALIDSSRKLVIEYTLKDDRDSGMDYAHEAHVSASDTRGMAMRLNVKVEDLPGRIHQECGISFESTPSHAESIFQQALEFILDCGVGYELREK